MAGSIKLELGGKAIGETTHYSAQIGHGVTAAHRDDAISETKRNWSATIDSIITALMTPEIIHMDFYFYCRYPELLYAN